MKIVADLLRKLAESGRTVLVSTHDGELVNNCCEHVMYIENGKVVRFE